MHASLTQLVLLEKHTVERKILIKKMIFLLYFLCCIHILMVILIWNQQILSGRRHHLHHSYRHLTPSWPLIILTNDIRTRMNPFIPVDDINSLMTKVYEGKDGNCGKN